jgi:ParB family transcriptional regulator, chromosome partitioning protein
MAAPETCPALQVIERERARIHDLLPPSEALFAWCLERTRDELLSLLAFIAATTVDAIQCKGDRPDAPRMVHAGQLANALGLDMRSWFVPGAENYFGQINRAGILAAIDEAKGSHAPALEKLKKGELAARAQELVANTNWLPEPMRPVTKAA